MPIDRTYLLETRAKAGLSQKALADKAGVSQQLIGALEKGTVSHTKHVFAIARALDILPGDLDSDIQPARSGGQAASISPPQPDVRPEIFTVYGVKTEVGGRVALSDRPVVLRPNETRGNFGIFMPDASMSPRFEPGEILEVSYGFPLAKGLDVAIIGEREPEGGDGMQFSRSLTIGRLVEWSDDHWEVQKLNPARKITLKRSDWPSCAVIVGHQIR